MSVNSVKAALESTTNFPKGTIKYILLYGQVIGLRQQCLRFTIVQHLQNLIRNTATLLLKKYHIAMLCSFFLSEHMSQMITYVH